MSTPKKGGNRPPRVPSVVIIDSREEPIPAAVTAPRGYVKLLTTRLGDDLLELQPYQYVKLSNVSDTTKTALRKAFEGKYLVSAAKVSKGVWTLYIQVPVPHDEA